TSPWTRPARPSCGTGRVTRRDRRQDPASDEGGSAALAASRGAVVAVHVHELDSSAEVPDEAARHLEETLGRIADEEAVPRPRKGLRLQEPGVPQDALRIHRRFRGGVHELDAVAEALRDDRAQERIVRAAEDHDISAETPDRLEVLPGDEARGRVIRPALLDEWHEQRAGLAENGRGDRKSGV